MSRWGDQRGRENHCDPTNGANGGPTGPGAISRPRPRCWAPADHLPPAPSVDQSYTPGPVGPPLVGAPLVTPLVIAPLALVRRYCFSASYYVYARNENAGPPGCIISMHPGGPASTCLTKSLTGQFEPNLIRKPENAKMPLMSATTYPPAAWRCSTLGDGGLNFRVRNGIG